MTPLTIRRSLAALAFVAFGSGAALAQGSPSPILDSVRVRQLVASEAPADQAALAAHFTALADRHASAARLHDTMGRSAAINPRGNGQEMKIHCQRLAGLEREAAATLRALAAHHAALGKGAASTAPARGAKYQAGAEARQPGDADMNALARRASTPADHRALQDYFQTFAARYEAEADGHVGMATLYRTTSRLAPVANHCDRLVTQLRAAAAEATQAATMHGVLATPK
jgi:hypothetical protein